MIPLPLSLTKVTISSLSSVAGSSSSMYSNACVVFNPLLFLYSQNHDFNQTEERVNPIEFLSAYKKNKKVNITIPDGFKFENIPTSKKFKTDDDSISYSYIVTQEGNKITIETSVLVDDSFFPKEYYPAFKQIFDAITKLEGQLVTVVKK